MSFVWHVSFVSVQITINLCTYLHTYTSHSEVVVKYLPTLHWLNPSFRTTLAPKTQVSKIQYSNPKPNLIENQHVTKNTYVFSFFLKQTNKPPPFFFTSPGYKFYVSRDFVSFIHNGILGA